MIVSNAGEEGAVVIGKIHESKETNFGYKRGLGQVRGPGCGRRHRSDQGHADGAAECSLDRWADADH